MGEREDEETLRERLVNLEKRADEDRRELARLRGKLEQGPLSELIKDRQEIQRPVPEKKPGALSLVFDVLLFILGAAGTFGFVLGEMSLHWGIAALVAPIGGAVVWLLGKAGATI